MKAAVVETEDAESAAALAMVLEPLGCALRGR